MTDNLQPEVTPMDFGPLENAELATVYDRLGKQEELKFDFLTSGRELVLENGALVLGTDNQHLLHVNDKPIVLDNTARSQMLGKLQIPTAYADRCQKDYPVLYDDNVNAWLHHGKGSEDTSRDVLLRTYYDPTAGTLRGRAFLSAKYQLIDNYQLFGLIMEEVQKAAQETGIYVVPSLSSLTDDGGMYLRFICPGIEMKSWAVKEYRNPETRDRGNGGIVTGFVVKNSETGKGKLVVAPRLVVDACKNSLIWTDEKEYCVVARHLGAGLEHGVVRWSNETVRKNLELIQCQLRDVLRRYMRHDFIGKTIQEIEKAASHELQNPVDAVLNIGKHMSVSEERVKNILGFFANQGTAMTGFDAIQAFTFEAQKQDSATRFDMESYLPHVMRRIGQFDVPENDFRNPASLRTAAEAELVAA